MQKLSDSPPPRKLIVETINQHNISSFFWDSQGVTLQWPVEKAAIIDSSTLPISFLAASCAEESAARSHQSWSSDAPEVWTTGGKCGQTKLLICSAPSLLTESGSHRPFHARIHQEELKGRKSSVCVCYLLSITTRWPLERLAQGRSTIKVWQKIWNALVVYITKVQDTKP